MSANRCVTARLRATDRPSSAGSNWFSVRWSSELPKNCVSHIDASHSRQPLVKGERLVRYEVNAVMASHETFGFSRQASKCAAYTHTHTHGGSFKKSARTIYGHALRGPPPPNGQWSWIGWVPPSPVVWCGFCAPPPLWCGVGSWGWLALVLLHSWKFAGRAALCALPPLLGVLVGSNPWLSGM